MLVIGLTGGIGTGKSEAARYLASLGAALIDADQVGHEAYQPDTEAWRQVTAAFGRDILQSNGEIDRRRLGIIVFADPEQLARLNAIMHPLMAEMVRERIGQLAGQGAEVVVVEAALLFEAGWDVLVDEVWATDAPEDAVVRRLAQRSGMSEADARRRVAAQLGREERLSRAGFVIDNSAGPDAMRSALGQLWDARVKGRIEQA